MPLFLHHKERACEWGVWRVSETYGELCALLPRATVEEAESRFAAPHRRQEWLAVRALLRQLAGRDAEVCYLPSGRPCLADGSACISISHTRGYVAVILGRGTVGIDIEQYGPRVHRVADRFMRDDEAALPFEGDDTWSLLLHWSAKETLFKCLDAEGVDFRRHLRIIPFRPARRGVFHAREYRTGERRRFFVRYLLHPGFVLTWAAG